MTGEEDEEAVLTVRGKLFSLSEQNQWKERGTGNLKLNVRKSDYGGARLSKRSVLVAYSQLLTLGHHCSHAQRSSLYCTTQCSIIQGDEVLPRAGPALPPVQRARGRCNYTLQSTSMSPYSENVELYLWLYRQVSNAKVADDLLDAINSHIPID